MNPEQRELPPCKRTDMKDRTPVTTIHLETGLYISIAGSKDSPMCFVTIGHQPLSIDVFLTHDELSKLHTAIGGHVSHVHIV